MYAPLPAPCWCGVLPRQVRIMKTRKTLDHQKLILEASNQLLRHFKPDPKQIKKRIEDLIAREYLERDANNNNVYKYLA